jgi:hypothetical protein
MAAEHDVVDVFVGSFDSQERLEQYLEEHYDEEDEDAPKSEFDKDQGETFCDHDFMESKFDDTAKSFAQLSEGHSFSEYWFAPAESAYKAQKIAKANVILLVFGKEINEPRSVKGEGYQLQYLGRFEREE